MDISFFSRLAATLPRHRRLLLLVGVASVVVLLAGWQAGAAILRSGGADRDQTGQASDADRLAGEILIPNTYSSWGTPGTAADGQTETGPASPSAPGAAGSTGTTNGNSPGTPKPSGGASAPSAPAAPAPTSPVVQATLRIPSSGTVLTLSGLNFNIYDDQPKKFLGIFSKAPYKMKKVDYPASIAADSITKGVAALNAQLRSNPGQKIVLAHSQGAQVASRWMRQYANDQSAPGAGEITFILTGNPLRSTGGYIIGRPEIGGTTGQPTPTTTKWPIVDVARRYDGWADWVRDAGNKWAVDNADAGKKTYHLRYDVVNLYASTHTIWKVGNTTYVLTKEDELPLWKNNADYPLSVRAAMRAHIEKAYDRPSNDPRPTLMPVTEQKWRDTLRGWGVSF